MGNALRIAAAISGVVAFAAIVGSLDRADAERELREFCNGARYASTVAKFDAADAYCRENNSLSR